MGCCGKGRQRLTAGAIETDPFIVDKPAAPPMRLTTAPPAATLWFEYVGSTGLTVFGPNSGKRYRFDRPGARVAVDPRDRASLVLVPSLRQVAGRVQTAVR